MRFPRRRDEVERFIVRALVAAGASVERLDGNGLPDLLVGYMGSDYLMEVKDPVNGARNSTRVSKKISSKRGLRESQEIWWSKWKGAEPSIVTSASEALRVIGAMQGDGNASSADR